MSKHYFDQAAAITAAAHEPSRSANLDGPRLLVYSHDSFGLGNIRRMLAICGHLRETVPGVSILILSGAPMLHSFRAVEGIDYVKLPCLRRTEDGELRVPFLPMSVAEVARLRRELILSIAQSFRPDALLVDKSPDGLAGELKPTLYYLKNRFPKTKILLVLRDILDSSKKTTQTWREREYYSLVQDHFDGVAVLGQQHLFDVRTEYEFPENLQQKTWFCGYLAKEGPMRSRAEVRSEIGVSGGDKLALVTTGGGEDGYHVLENYLNGLAQEPGKRRLKTLIVTGPALAPDRARAIHGMAQAHSSVHVLDFSDDMLSCCNAADVIVSVAGYNTVCEILTFRKQAVVVPRVHQVEEQRIRAERMSKRALFQMILPGDLSPQLLMDAVVSHLDSPHTSAAEGEDTINLGVLPRVRRLVMDLLAQDDGSMDSARVNAAGAGLQ
jgi:predicted glycosyltransferase